MEQNPIHENLLDKAIRIGQRILYFFPLQAPDHMSNHYTHPLDQDIEAQDQPRWDDMGTYLDRDD